MDLALKGFVHYRLLITILNLWPITFFIFQGGKDHMKKNLRIVSAAAAALLAVAPVAATVVPAASTVSAAVKNVVAGDVVTVDANLNGKLAANGAKAYVPKGVKATVVKADKTNATVRYTANGKSYTVIVPTADLLKNSTKEATSTKPATTSSDKINAGSSSVFYANTNTVVNISAVAATKSAPSAINGNIVYTDAKGQSHTALLHNLADGKNTKITDLDGKGQNSKTLKPGMYVADFKGVYVNLGNEMANQPVTFNLGGGAVFMDKGAKNNGRTLTVAVDANGVAKLGEVKAPFWAYDSTDLQEVHFYSVKTGNVVPSGSVSLHAVNGQLNVNSVFAALTQEYKASQLTKSENVDTFVPVNDIKAQLEKQNVKVDDNGYFTAPASFTLNMTAKSNNNGATASLPVTVNVDNVTPTAANETTTTKTVMHIATIYDKNGNATSEPVLRAYDSVSVVSTPVELKDAAGKSKGMYYKLAGKDQYVKVGNIDGTSRTLKHNAYVYKSNGKRNKAFKTLKKGSSKTTYGKSFMINGSQMYRVGRNQYVKVANFR